MKLTDYINAVTEKRKVKYDGTEYIPCGYEWLVLNGKQHKTAILQDRKNERCRLCVDLSLVEAI